MATYNVPTYDEKKYRQGIDTSYYTNAIKDYTKQAEANRTRQINEARSEQTANLKSAYLNRLQNEQKMNQNLAMSGIRGGMSETANLNLANQYGQARSAANTDYANSVKSINQTIDQNIADYTSDMKSRAEEYRQNLAQSKWQAAREDAINKYNAAREDAQTAYDRAYTKQQDDTAYWSNYYTNRYSGFSKKNVKKAIKAREAELAKATTDSEKRRIQQAISAAYARLGVIATSK